MEQLLYGAAYYDEYMPCDRLDRDVEMMKAANINVVRIAESTWATLEPQIGRFDFSHIDRVLDAMEKAGISVIVGTPTYAIPPWLASLHPEVLADTNNGRERYGRRQNMDITSPAFLFYAERVIRALLAHVAGRACVIGFQLDNETKHYGTAGQNVQKLFVKYLRGKFGDTERLNAAFGLAYWSNRIDVWEDFPDVRGTINASLGAEFARFQRSLVTDYLAWQAAIVNEYRSKEQFVTHNFDFEWKGYSYGVQPDVDHFAASKCLTVAGCDIYHPTQDDLTGAEISFCGDLTRSLKQDNYLVLETQAQGFAEWLPYKGQLRLQAYSHLASGANMVEYWHWHSIHNAMETYWKGLLSHDFLENPTYDEAKRIGGEFRRLSPHLVNLKKRSDVAILVSNASLTGLEWFKIDERTSYNAIVRWIYDTLYKMNVGVDFISPEETELDRYGMLVAPALYAADDALLNRITAYVEQGGHLVTTFKCGFCDENLKVSANAQPNMLSNCCGVTYSQFTKPKNVTLTGFDLPPEQLAVSAWMELLTPQTAEVLAYYSHPQWKEYAAVTKNRYGAGSAVYIGCMTGEAVLRELFARELRQAFLYGEEQAYGFPVIIKKGMNSLGRTVVYYMNYSPERKNIVYGFGNGVELISGRKLEQGAQLTLEPWDLQIAEFALPV